jgi:TolB protein
VKRICFFITAILFSLSSWAELTIEITQGRDNPTSIAIVPFSWQQGGLLPEDIAGIVESDLHRSGQFEPLSRNDMLGMPHEQSEVYYRDWRALAVDYLLVGKVLPHEGQLMVQYELFDVTAQQRILQGKEFGRTATLRDVSHVISDKVYQKLTGIRGAFSTKILYVSAIKRSGDQYTYRLLMSDIDGAREKVLLEQSQPILTPTWSPDGDTIAYVSFETTRPAIFMHKLSTGQRTQLTNFRGLNGAPAWSPDGRKLAMVLSKDGSPDIYVMDVASRKLQRVTRHFGIDTEPAWMPDGQSLVYTSDRGGKPQIYQVRCIVMVVTFISRFTISNEARSKCLPRRHWMNLPLWHRMAQC